MATKAQVKALQQQLAQLQQHCADQEALCQGLDQMAERQKSKEEELRSLSKGVTVVMSRDRKLRKYGGRDEEDFEPWEADTLAAISGPGMGDKEKCEFLYNKLEGGCAPGDSLSGRDRTVFSTDITGGIAGGFREEGSGVQASDQVLGKGAATWGVTGGLQSFPDGAAWAAGTCRPKWGKWWGCHAEEEISSWCIWC